MAGAQAQEAQNEETRKRQDVMSILQLILGQGSNFAGQGAGIGLQQQGLAQQQGNAEMAALLSLIGTGVGAAGDAGAFGG